MNHEWFAGRLRELREQAGLTQQQLADKTGLSQNGISQWERGEREPSWSNVLALCQALGCSCEDFHQAPANRDAPGPGRPKKPEEPPAEPPVKKPRGRPKKDEEDVGGEEGKGGKPKQRK